MSIAKEIGNNITHINNADTILRALITNNNNLTEYVPNTTYKKDDVVYRLIDGKIYVYKAINNEFTESSFTPTNWKNVNVDNFYFGDNSPEISNIEPTDVHTKVWFKPI